jgi:putative ABC transport system permease protein
VAVVALGVALAVIGLIMTQTVKDGVKRAAAPYDMIIGSKGSSTQLVMNTIFLQDVPLGNIPHAIYEKLAADDRVAAAVPMGFGDSLHNFRIVGTTPQFFDLREKPGAPAFFTVAAGRLFAGDFEAVLGAPVAQRLGLKPGDQFTAAHGVTEGKTEEDHEEHHTPYTVVGVLKPTGGPADMGIYTSLASVWAVHELAPGTPGDVTAVLVRPKSIGGLMRIYQEINAGKDAQAVFPGQVMAKLFDMMGKGQSALQFIAILVLVMASLTIVISLVSASAHRRREIAIMRSLGARRSDVFRIMLWESALLGAGGVVAGLALAHGLGVVLRWRLAAESGMSVGGGRVAGELWVLGAVMALSLLAGLVPAAGVYRVQVARHLTEQ